ncbi:Peptidyl-prolyl cis-trans isomerase-like 2 [Hondaea fermentalgiana]|uniref:Peptidyl-prolyl cis-trans isomerase-like 2 n=1 Tax=Hondaea fermentalgiana TaxID=2315210 RepID=A0A2R5GSC5_9STRA|nr:Peptidyl-prolyl cis-trans isomerase-like 2 [Hondaea fermentalgiana]|eukprot:GBG33209.1 Peptidyl-prolyl cis-trans isomerase-like 2 [Hondaea fermentalgiana]
MAKGAKKLHERATERQRGDQDGGTQASEAEGLPFDCCALSLVPWTSPVMAVVQEGRGLVFELSHIAVYVKKHGVDPVYHKPLAREDLVTLHWSRNGEGKLHCPVTFKVFTQFSNIVAIRDTGNVFSREAVENLCILPRVWRDPITNEQFAGREAIITLHSAHSQSSGTPTTGVDGPPFVTSAKKVSGASTESAPSIRMSGIAERILQKAEASARRRAAAASSAQTSSANVSVAKSSEVQTSFTSGMCAASLTSTAVTPQTSNARQIANARELELRRYRAIRQLKKKAYARLETTHGDLNLEVYCNFTPQTAENFLGLAEKGYYDGTSFHRLIPGFMVQGGDPTGTGRGGESLWGEAFPDELDPGNMHLKHSKRGLLSMANSGPNTNRSQFFITFAPKAHLDTKHTVFGRVVGGLEVLDKIEAIKTGKDDLPLEPITIKRALVFVNPIREFDKAQAQEHPDSATNEGAVEHVAEYAEVRQKDADSVAPKAKKRRVREEDVAAARKPSRTGVVFKNFSDW